MSIFQTCFSINSNSILPMPAPPPAPPHWLTGLSHKPWPPAACSLCLKACPQTSAQLDPSPCPTRYQLGSFQLSLNKYHPSLHSQYPSLLYGLHGISSWPGFWIFTYQLPLPLDVSSMRAKCFVSLETRIAPYTQ